MIEQKQTGVAELVQQKTTAGTASRHIRYALVLTMDLLARTGYQMGKSPVLPLFAAALGSGTAASGMIVAVSTTTGLITSPLIGAISDFYGRRRPLLIGTALFAFMPFLYLLIQTPGQLFLVRIVHGFATAIYGPVVAALIADMFDKRRAEYVGFYRSVRSASYLLGPLLGGFVLFYANFRTAWIVVGILGLAACLPALALLRSQRPAVSVQRDANTIKYLRQNIFHAFKSPTLLALGVIEAALYFGLRANKAFLPLYAISVDVNPSQIGMVFSIQVVVILLAQPIGGYLADRWGRKPVIVAGLLLVAGSLPLMVIADEFVVFVALAVVLGLGEAFAMPSIITLGTELSDKGNYGATLGMLDAMDNVGKALGPIVAGLLLAVFSYATTFTIIAGILVAVAAIFLYNGPRSC